MVIRAHYETKVVLITIQNSSLASSEIIILIFTLIKTAFLCFSLYKIIENENIPDNYKTLKTSTGAIIKILKS